jgi:hypothetical protein
VSWLSAGYDHGLEATFYHSPSPDEDSGDDEFGRDDDDLSSPSKPKEPSITRTRSGRVSRGVNRAVMAGSQAAARLLAAAAAVEEEAAARAISNGDSVAGVDETPIAPSEDLMEHALAGEMRAEEVETQEGSTEQDEDMTGDAPERQEKSTVVRGRKNIRGRKGK